MTEAGCATRIPAFHLDDLELDVELQRAHEPARELSERETVTHRHRTRADEAFPSGCEPQPFYGPADRVGAVEHPHRFVVRGRRFEDIAQRRDERIDPAAEVLQVDEQHVESRHHLCGGPTHVTVEAENRNAVYAVGKVGRFDHVVLLVAAQPVLRAEAGRKIDLRERAQNVEGMHEIARNRGRMREEGHTLSGERRAERRILEQAVDSELHEALTEAP